MLIRAVLFDADGVIQKRPAGWTSVLQEILGSNRDLDCFLADVFSAEGPALCGGCDFAVGLADVLKRWECSVALPRLLHVWTMLEVDPDIAQIIRTLKKGGIQCHLATNQEAYRAQHMSKVLGYKELFDREFYSCNLGVAKPAPAFFLAILESIALQPDSVLFLDDRQENVVSADGVGIHSAEFALSDGPDLLRRVLQSFEVQPFRH